MVGKLPQRVKSCAIFKCGFINPDIFSWLNLSFFLSSYFLPETPDPLSEREQQMDPSSPAGIVID